MNYSTTSTLKRKFKLTTLQLSALVILPLFIFALAIKIKQRQEKENTAQQIIITKDTQQQDYMTKTASQPVIKGFEDVNADK